MAEEEAVARIHPLRQASVFILAPMILMDTFFVLFTQTFRARDMGAEWAAFLLVPFSTGAQVVTELFWGWMADKYGRRLPLVLGGCFTIPALVLFALATEPWHLLAAAAFRGLGGSAGIPITRAIVADLAPRKVLGERMGALTMAMYPAPFIGITFSGIIYEINTSLPFFIAAATELAAILIVVFVVPETIIKKRLPRKPTETQAPSRIDLFKQGAKEWYAILSRRGPALYIFATLLGTLIGSAAGTVVFPLFAGDLGLTPKQITLVYTAGMIIGVMGVVPGGKLSDKIGRKWPVLFQGFYGALTWPLYALVPGMASPFLGFVVIQMVSSASVVVGGPAFSAYYFEWLHPRERGKASAMSEFFSDLGMTVGYPIVGALYLTFNPLYIFYFAAITGVFIYSVVLIAWKDAPKSEERK